MAQKRKKGKDVEINIEELPPWKSLNISYNFNTCIKT